ncbi:GNAT family N-acetyltransferase [Nocardioides agariphilus]|jgi:GNAT superfamily N-acetyltransferase|uniref:GNAT family N-acetyltransferase n=1 Tax=Nocardioides agariphilus TaxID=433664 RepID=A0A930YHU4_9ACTN|nr:GNAT family N-acetyltransferase [Nocardioides agariphilus]MBF4767383.1 GNAT family N-acetyltransferase [Nocardioides agariphilus]
MSRSLVYVREAVAADAELLADLWADLLRRGDEHDRVADMSYVVTTASDDPDQRLVVAEYDGHLAGAVHLRLTTITPLNLDASVQVMSPQVFPEFRRHGVGRALMDAAVTWAEECGAGHLVAAAPSGSRDGNRFMARLALGPIATFRLAPTTVVRAKLMAQRPPVARVPARQLTHVLAVRRSMRRQSAESV